MESATSTNANSVAGVSPGSTHSTGVPAIIMATALSTAISSTVSTRTAMATISHVSATYAANTTTKETYGSECEYCLCVGACTSYRSDYYSCSSWFKRSI